MCGQLSECIYLITNASINGDKQLVIKECSLIQQNATLIDKVLISISFKEGL